MDNQVISQPYLNSRLRDGAADPNIPPDLNAWRMPRGERFCELPDTGGQRSSTLLDGKTSQWAAYAQGAADHISDFPLPAWEMRFQREMQVYEINHPVDWHELCVRYPAMGKDGRFIPDWSRVAEEFDGVHLTLGGLLTCEQNPFEQDGKRSMHRSWHAKSTYWLRPIKISLKRINDAEADPISPEYVPYRYDGEWYELVSGSAGFFKLK